MQNAPGTSTGMFQNDIYAGGVWDWIIYPDRRVLFSPAPLSVEDDSVPPKAEACCETEEECFKMPRFQYRKISKHRKLTIVLSAEPLKIQCPSPDKPSANMPICSSVLGTLYTDLIQSEV